MRGFTLQRNNLKDDLIRRGITKYDFDIFGIAETNMDWRLCPEQDKLYFCTKEWWDSVHILHSHNCTSRPTVPHQWGALPFLPEQILTPSNRKGNR
jgi:hypothetical protein